MPVLTSVAEVLVKGTIANAAGRSTAVEQVFHYTFKEAYNPAVLPNLQAIANGVTLGPATTMLTLIQSDYTWNQTLARWLDDVTVAYIAGNDTLGSSTISTARLPSDVTVRFRLTTSTRGKEYKGAKSFRPIPEAQVTGDELTSGAQTSWGAMSTALASSITVSAQVMYPCIVSRKLSQLRTNPVAIIGDTLTQAAFNISLGTMKGRHRRAVP